MSLHRAHETPSHPRGKQDLGRLLSRRGFLVLYEHQFADAVAFRPTKDGLRILCGEHDLRIHTVAPNVRRNFANGCHAMVILVPEDSARAAVRRLLRREFSRSICTRIGILTHEICRRQLAQPRCV